MAFEGETDTERDELCMSGTPSEDRSELPGQSCSAMRKALSLLVKEAHNVTGWRAALQ